MNGFRHYEVRLRRSRRTQYVFARRLLVTAAFVAPLIVALYVFKHV